MRFKPSQSILYCFSPPVMIATFIIEVLLVAMTLWRYKLSSLTRLVCVLLLLLATFQLAEFMICQQIGWVGVEWSRIGFVAITLLPPIGLHIVQVLANRQNRRLLVGAYSAALLFAGYFLLATSAFTNQVCQGNYVIFGLPPEVTILYSVYYYGAVLTGLGLSWYFSNKTKVKTKVQALRLFAIGYASFLVPTATVNLIAPETLAGIPSIMCGFAVVLAIAIGVGVLPRVAQKRQK